MGEFDLIARYFSRHKRLKRSDILQSVGDDCAVLALPERHCLAITTDTLVVNTHFLPTISAADLAYKSVAVNLSDLAAMGAIPAWVSLALTLPDINPIWLEEFSQSLFEALDEHQVALIGGDTTKGKLSLTLTAQGFLPEGKGLYRHNAQVGDAIFVSGYLGDSAGGLDLLLNKKAELSNSVHKYLLTRHFRPTARVLLGQKLTEYSCCALDISDGLLADLGHILTESRCGAEIWVDKLPLSSALLQCYTTNEAEQFALCGGEDYELCFTVPQRNIIMVQQMAAELDIPCHHIGHIIAPTELRLTKHHKPYSQSTLCGFDHFTRNE